MRDRVLRDQLIREIESLADNPRPHGHVKLSGYENLYRVRKGDWRIVYLVQDEQLLILIIEVATRGNAYKNL